MAGLNKIIKLLYTKFHQNLFQITQEDLPTTVMITTRRVIYD